MLLETINPSQPLLGLYVSWDVLLSRHQAVHNIYCGTDEIGASHVLNDLRTLLVLHYCGTDEVRVIHVDMSAQEH